MGHSFDMHTLEARTEIKVIKILSTVSRASLIECRAFFGRI